MLQCTSVKKWQFVTVLSGPVPNCNNGSVRFNIYITVHGCL